MNVRSRVKQLLPGKEIRHFRAIIHRHRHAEARKHYLTDAQVGSVESHGTPITYYEYGPADADVTVVFVHGFTLAAESFFPQVEFLRSHWPEVRILLVDLRGHGKSGRVSRDDCRLDYAADDVLAALAERPAAGQIILLGHSLGSPVSLAVLRRAPSDVLASITGVIQVSGAVDVMARRGIARILNSAPIGALFSTFRRRPSSVLRLRERVTALIPPTLEMFFFIRHTPDELIDFHAGLIADTPTETIVGFGERLRVHQEFEAMDELADKLGFILVGDKDFVTPISQSRLLHERWPKAKIQVAPNAGHMLPLEAPGIVCAALDRLLTQLLPDQDRVNTE